MQLTPFASRRLSGIFFKDCTNIFVPKSVFEHARLENNYPRLQKKKNQKS
jgi:hypothetical protein